jgi:hypothetical protein
MFVSAAIAPTVRFCVPRGRGVQVGTKSGTKRVGSWDQRPI